MTWPISSTAPQMEKVRTDIDTRLEFFYIPFLEKHYFHFSTAAKDSNRIAAAYSSIDKKLTTKVE